MALSTLSDLLVAIAAKFPQKSMANPTNSDINAMLVELANSGGGSVGARAVVPTADGLTTGILADTDTLIQVNSADANHIVTLPLASASLVGKRVRLKIGATAAELRTPAASGQTINGVDSDGTAEALLAANNYYEATCTLATGWILLGWTALGAPVAAIVPDA